MQYTKLVLLALFLSGCSINYVSIQEEWVDCHYLASSYVKTLDPDACNPPCGKNLLIEWNFPISIFRKDLCIILTARLNDNSTFVYKHRIKTKRGCLTKFFSFKDLKKRLLTYKVEVVDKNCKIVESVENQFWTEEIILMSE